MKQADEQTLQFILLSLHKSKPTGSQQSQGPVAAHPQALADLGTRGGLCTLPGTNLSQAGMSPVVQLLGLGAANVGVQVQSPSQGNKRSRGHAMWSKDF